MRSTSLFRSVLFHLDMIHGYTHLEDPLSDISGNFVPHTDTLYRIVIGIIRKVILPYLGGRMTSASLAESISIFYPLPRLDFRAKWGPNSDKNSVSRKRQRLCARNGNRPLHRCHFPLKYYYITNSDFPQGLSCFSSVPHARKYPAGRRNYSERSFGTTLNSKEEENALQDRGPPKAEIPEAPPYIGVT